MNNRPRSLEGISLTKGLKQAFVGLSGVIGAGVAMWRNPGFFENIYAASKIAITSFGTMVGSNVGLWGGALSGAVIGGTVSAAAALFTYLSAPARKKHFLDDVGGVGLIMAGATLGSIVLGSAGFVTGAYKGYDMTEGHMRNLPNADIRCFFNPKADDCRPAATRPPGTSIGAPDYYRQEPAPQANDLNL